MKIGVCMICTTSPFTRRHFVKHFNRDRSSCIDFFDNVRLSFTVLSLRAPRYIYQCDLDFDRTNCNKIRCSHIEVELSLI